MNEPMRIPIQVWMDGMSKAWAKERAASQMTLGELIAALDELPTGRRVVGFGEPHSYRGYYEDLAFEPSQEAETVAELRERCQNCMGQIFEGYKGGDFPMHANTAVWISSYGVNSGDRLVALDIESDVIRPITKPEEW